MKAVGSPAAPKRHRNRRWREWNERGRDHRENEWERERETEREMKKKEEKSSQRKEEGEQRPAGAVRRETLEPDARPIGHKFLAAIRIHINLPADEESDRDRGTEERKGRKEWLEVVNVAIENFRRRWESMVRRFIKADATSTRFNVGRSGLNNHAAIGSFIKKWEKRTRTTTSSTKGRRWKRKRRRRRRKKKKGKSKRRREKWVVAESGCNRSRDEVTTPASSVREPPPQNVGLSQPSVSSADLPPVP